MKPHAGKILYEGENTPTLGLKFLAYEVKLVVDEPP
jgi:hypothetical protein